VHDAGRISAFVSVLAAYVRANGYDGLDLDWEAGVIPAQYQDLVRRLRLALPDRILTADIAMSQRHYLVAIQDYLDRINLMSYDLWGGDYRGRQLRETWHHAALRAGSPDDPRQTAEAGLQYVLGVGIRPEKVNLAVPFYGYAFQGCLPGYDGGTVCQKALSSPLEPIGRGGVQKTQVEYNRIMATFGTGEVRWDPVHSTPYISYRTPRQPGCTVGLCVGDAFVTFTDERQMRESVALVNARRLGGIMTFALHQEFMAGRQGDARYPLTSAIYDAIMAAGDSGSGERLTRSGDGTRR
jgi:GH18 family chitinase